MVKVAKKKCFHAKARNKISGKCKIKCFKLKKIRNHSQKHFRYDLFSNININIDKLIIFKININLLNRPI